MGSLIDQVHLIADQFTHVIESHSKNLQLIPTEDYGWSNTRWFSEQFRLAHMERFDQPKFSVLHMVIWPHVMDPSAIFGFDVIASDKLVTGLFWDLSPTILPTKPFCSHTWSEPRQRPDWGHIFSEHWVACRPTPTELVQIGDLAVQCLKNHMADLGKTSTHRVNDVVRAQNTYSLCQRQNEHTTKVIHKLLGPVRAEEFINQILFPTL